MSRWAGAVIVCGVLCGSAFAEPRRESTSKPAEATADQSDTAPAKNEQKYLLRYKFQPGELVRWQVEHRAQIRTTVSGTTQTAETLSTSVKVWRITNVEASGQATLEHQVQSVDMRQKLTGRQEVHYNSQTDKEPPLGFEQVAEAVGVTLAEIVLDPQGKVVRREQKVEGAPANLGVITIPLPTESVAVGHEWRVPSTVEITQRDGRVKKIKTQQLFTLEEVEAGMARIRVATQVLSPINDPTIEVQLVQGKSNGIIRFDIEAGRITEQQTDVDERVHGFQGEASSLHCLTRFTEKLLPASETQSETSADAAANDSPPPKTPRVGSRPKKPARR